MSRPMHAMSMPLGKAHGGQQVPRGWGQGGGGSTPSHVPPLEPRLSSSSVHSHFSYRTEPAPQGVALSHARSVSPPVSAVMKGSAPNHAHSGPIYPATSRHDVSSKSEPGMVGPYRPMGRRQSSGHGLRGGHVPPGYGDLQGG